MYKKLFLTSLVVTAFLMFGKTMAQETAGNIPLIGEKAPSFTAQTTQGTVNFPKEYKGKWVVFFSHPSDFTPVCTTEFMTFAKEYPEFKKMNTELIGLSVDSVSSHIAWLNTIKNNIEYKDMKNMEINFPVVADLGMNVSKKYGMVQTSADAVHTVRAVYVIDPESTVRAIIYYPPTTGRNIDEIKRLVTALQTTDKYKVATPANWTPGEKVIIPPADTYEKAQERAEQPNCVDWFMCFKELPLK
jgi:peroxiredoxin (alkyl hydroperoxide reductase subunit C)